MPTSSIQSVSLYFKQGASDKEYHASIDPEDGRYVVNFRYGRRGATLQTGTKTTTPVDLQTATKIFTKLVTEKKAKGYTEGEAGTPYQHTEKENCVTNILPQLLNPIEDADLAILVPDENWCAQEKFDGKRILLQKKRASVYGINRKGLIVALPFPLVVAANAFDGDFILDGESIGEKLHVFDLLTLNDKDLRDAPYHARVSTLRDLLATVKKHHILFAETAWSRTEKRDLLTTLREKHKEGIVFKRIDAPYTEGRPASGGTQVKHKFYATLSALVGAVNTKRSIEIQLFDEKGLVSAGNVTIPPNHAIPKVGQVVEVRYLYAFRESGSVYQPVYLGPRSDVSETDCVTTQLKFKRDEE